MASQVKLLILHDCDGWAQHQNAIALQRYAPQWCSVTVAKLGTVSPEQFDAVYSLNLPSVGPGQVGCVASHAWMYPAYDQSDWSTRGVNDNRNNRNGQRHLATAGAVTCRNHALGEWAKRFCNRVAVFPAGIDPAVYYPPADKPLRRKLRVGWCGQVREHEPGECKGFKEIYLPLVERLGNRYEFEANTRTPDNALSVQEMAEWFRSLDVFLSTSCNDGTPNPPFQAAACGCAIIGTDVGQLADWQALRRSGGCIPAYRNQSEAAMTIELIAAFLEMLEHGQFRRYVVDSTLLSIETEYNYKVLAPKTLEFICGVAG